MGKCRVRLSLVLNGGGRRVGIARGVCFRPHLSQLYEWSGFVRGPECSGVAVTISVGSTSKPTGLSRT